MSDVERTAPAPNTHRHRRMVLWGARALGYVVYAYVVLTEIVLALGFVLLLFGANPDPPFVQWAYRSLERAMEPFRGIFTSIELGQTGNERRGCPRQLGAVRDAGLRDHRLVGPRRHRMDQRTPGAAGVAAVAGPRPDERDRRGATSSVDVGVSQRVA